MKNSNKVYMILTNGFDPDVRVYKEAKYLVENGFDVTILCWDRMCKYGSKLEENIEKVKIKRFEILSQPGTGMKQLIPYFKFLLKVRKYLKDKEYDYLHCHDLDGVIIGVATRKVKKKKIIFDMHEFYESGRYSRIAKLVRKIVNKMQNKAYKIIYVNQQQIQSVDKKNMHKLVYLPNYPSKLNFSNINHISSNNLRITYAGYIRHPIPIKNLIEAVGNNKEFHISIHGTGDVYYDIKKMEETYSNLTVTGKYDHSEIAKFYSNTDLMYIVYNKGNKNDETALPTKFFEAIICKIPIIVSQNSLLEEMVKKYNIGFVVDGTDKKSIERELQKIVQDKKILNEKISNIEKIPEKFIWEEVVKNLDSIYGD